jgi:allantoinase
MSDEKTYDLLVKSVKLVRPHQTGVGETDIAIKDGKFLRVEPKIPAESAGEVVDGHGLLAFPGVVDAHQHVGIYNQLSEDAVSESQAAAMGGVTTGITYIRTGQYYLNRGGSYADFFPEVLRRSEGNFYVDYAYHVAPIAGQHIEELPLLAEEFGVPSFKIFMFYGGYGLHGRSGKQQDFLMIGEDESYDFAHFEFILRGVKRLMEEKPELADFLSVSLHCETAEIMNAYTRMVEQDGKLEGLRAYHEARPPHSEGLAIWIAAYLAYETECPNINLLHLSSRKALEAAMMMQEVFPHINFRREVTVGHLLLDVDAPTGCYAKVNPPIRPREDVEFLWQGVLDGKIHWIITDHACCRHEMKVDQQQPDKVFLAKSGFGGAEYLLSGVFSEGVKRGLSLNRIAELVCWNAAQRYGLRNKGDVAVGYDADLVLFDPEETFVVRAEESPCSQEYTPFEGQELTGRVKKTFLRGELIWDGQRIVGPPRGRYLRRPTAAPEAVPAGAGREKLEVG